MNKQKQENNNYKRVDVMSTRCKNYVGALRASMYKQGERNLLKNITDGLGYEGVIELYEYEEN